MIWSSWVGSLNNIKYKFQLLHSVSHTMPLIHVSFIFFNNYLNSVKCTHDLFIKSTVKHWTTKLISSNVINNICGIVFLKILSKWIKFKHEKVDRQNLRNLKLSSCLGPPNRESVSPLSTCLHLPGFPRILPSIRSDTNPGNK